MAINSASVRLRIAVTHEDTIDSAASDWPLTAKAVMDHTVSFTNGTTANKFDLLYMQERTVSDGANDDIDLNAVITDAFGSTITAVDLVALLVLNEPEDNSTPNTTNLTIGLGSAPIVSFFGAGTTKSLGPIGPSGALLLVTPTDPGWAITATTADNLRITNSAGAANTYQLGLFMRSA